MLPERWIHQQYELDQNGSKHKRMMCWSPRLGKSRAALDFILKHKPLRAVISAPLIVCPQWVSLLTDAGLTPILGYGISTTRASSSLQSYPNGIFVVNDDRLAPLLSSILRWKPEMYIGDESHRFRGVSSKRGKAMRKIAWVCDKVRLLTGTPTPNHMGNLWGQLVAVNKDSWGSSYEQFARKFLIRDPVFKNRVLGVLRTDELRAKLLDCASILRREDVFGPDQWQTIVRYVDLPIPALALYRKLVKEWIIEDSFKTGETIDATHKLKRIVRLQQLTSGYLPDEEGRVHRVHTAKIDTVFADLEEIIEANEKVIIFHRFTHEGLEYYERACNTYGSEHVFRIAGDVDTTIRTHSIDLFNTSKAGCIFICQTQSGGIGISFASATHAFFVSQGFNFDDEQQARDRIYSPGDRKCVTYFRVRNSVDGFISRILEAKANIHVAITSADIRELAFNHDEIQHGKGII